MPERLTVEQADFEELCEHIRESKIVSFDTEFVSENTFRPELCLLQFATSERCTAVDPYQVGDLSSWWEIMNDEETTVIVHSGREEVRFCLTVTGQAPRKLVDVQIAEGLRSRSFPLSHSALVKRVLGNKAHGKETRTDWKRRPLSKKQIDYALEDVKYLIEIWQRQSQSLSALGRLSWADAEFQRMIDEVTAERSGESWRRLSGIHKLVPRELAIARELYRWRERDASQRNQPVRRILRDDLLLDLARRQPRSVSEVLATRDMNRSNFKRSASELVECISTGMAVPKEDLPQQTTRSDAADDEHVLGKILAIALANRCAELDVSTGLVGTNSDLRELVRWQLYSDQAGNQPRLMQGWRSEVCGDLLHDVLDGKISLRVAHPDSDHPLVFERVEDAE